MKVLTLAIPTKISIHATTVLSLLASLRSIKDFIVKLEILPGKSNIDQSRSIMLTRWYDSASDDDIFMFIDSDQTFTKEDIEDVIALNGDVNVGIYVNRANLPTCFPKNHQKFFTKQDNELLYGATGFMAITKPILKKVVDYLKIENRMNGEPRFWIDNHHQNIIPFFTQRLIDTEVKTDNNGGPNKQWLGEDYGFCWLIRQCGGTIKGHLSPTIGHDINDVKYFTHVNKIPDNWDDKSIVYFTGTSMLRWSANDIQTKGLGGSETAVIKLSEEWSKLGYNVTVFGNCATETVNNVEYKHFSKFKPVDNFNILILWRLYGLSALSEINSYKKLYVDLHDLPSQNYKILYDLNKKIDKIFVKSEYHKNTLDKTIHDKVCVLENGLMTEILDKAKVKNITRNKKKLLYTSCYTRGLMDMLKYGFPNIKKHIPEIEFHICYGMELVRDQKFKNEMNELLKQDGIVNHHRLGQDELSELRESCYLHYYVGKFNETDCISVKESLYSGLKVVVSNNGAFKERSKYFKIITGDATTKDVQENASKYIIDLINGTSNIDKFDNYPFKSWEKVAKEWVNIFSENKVKYGIFKKIDEVFVKKDHIGVKFNKLMKRFIGQDCDINKFKIYNKPQESQIEVKDNPYFKNLTKNQVLEYMSEMSIWGNSIENKKELVLVMNDSVEISENFINKLISIDFTDIDMLVLTDGKELDKVERINNCSAYIMKSEMMKKISDDIQNKYTSTPMLEFLNQYVNIFNIQSINLVTDNNSQMLKIKEV
jgi:glycosyltransferase involved in cell wall biosynthesis